MTEKSTQSTSSNTTSNGKRADIGTPFHAALSIWRQEWERYAKESEKAMDRGYAEAERMMNEGFRLATAELAATREATRVMNDAFRRAMESVTGEA